MYIKGRWVELSLSVTDCRIEEYLFVQKTAIKDGGNVVFVVRNDAIKILSL